MLTDDERHRLAQLEGKADSVLTLSERSELDALRYRRHESSPHRSTAIRRDPDLDDTPPRASRPLRAIRRDSDLDDTTRRDSDEAIQRDSDLS